MSVKARMGWRLPLLAAVIVSMVTVVAGGRHDADARVGPAVRAAPAASCAPVDVALVLDSTTSMDPAIEQVKSGLAGVISTIQTVSGDDYRLALVDFGRGVTVHQTFAPGDAAAVRDLLPGLRQTSNNSNDPEAWDEALRTVVTGRSANDAGPGNQVGDFGVPWRPEAKKLVILVTDAMPAGFDDQGSDADVASARAVAADAAAAGIRVTTIFVPNPNSMPEARDVLQDVAETTGSTGLATLADGSNLDVGLNLVTTECGADSDGDGLWDRWETEGYDGPDADSIVDVDLPAMGFTPDHKDLLLQVNWMPPGSPAGCTGWVCPVRLFPVGEPDAAALEQLVDFYAHAPTPNPDGTQGIRLHLDAGPLTPPSVSLPEADRRGGPISRNADRLPDGHEFFTEMDRYRDEAVEEARQPLTTFVLYGRKIHADAREGQPPDDETMGKATGVPSDSVAIASAMMTSTRVELVTLAHEIGHTLGLHHGGNDDFGKKPNYLSVMNYDIALGGGVQVGDRVVVDYSRWDVAPIDQSRLDETQGLRALVGDLPDATTTYRCPAKNGKVAARTTKVNAPIDWMCDGAPASTAAQSLVAPQGKVPLPTVLVARNDWATLSFGGGVRGGLESEGEPVDDEGSFDYGSWRTTEKAHAVELLGPGPVTAAAGARGLELRWVATNLGTEPDRFTIDATPRDGWQPRTIATPDPIDLDPGESADLTVTIDVPADLDVGAATTINLTIASERGGDGAAEPAVVEIARAPDVDTTDGRPGITFTPAAVAVGEHATGIARGFEPGATIAVRVTGKGGAPTQVTADGQGRIEIPVEVSGVGDITVAAVGEAQTSSSGSASSTTTTLPSYAGAAAAPVHLIELSGVVTGQRTIKLERSESSSVGLAIVIGIIVVALIALGVTLAARRRA